MRIGDRSTNFLLTLQIAARRRPPWSPCRSTAALLEARDASQADVVIRRSPERCSGPGPFVTFATTVAAFFRKGMRCARRMNSLTRTEHYTNRGSSTETTQLAKR
jgi:hypothetical protein